MRSWPAPPVAVALVGAAATAGVAWWVAMDPVDSAKLALTAAGAAAATGLVGVAVLRRRSHVGLGAKAGVVALTVVASCAIGAWAAARAMFLSAHDLAALGVILVSAATAAVVVALVLAHRLGQESRDVLEVARRLGGDDTTTPAVPATRELASIAAELRRVGRDLSDAQRRERALDASRRELIAWVSHDLRTPLSAIRAVTQALEDQVVTDAETVARYHRTLRVESERLARLVDDLFELSRTQAGVLELTLERVSLEDLVSDAIAGAAPVARARGIRLEGRLTSGVPTEVELSAREIARALRNLLENAIRHTPSDGTIDVEAGVEDGHVYVSVSDACGGIPEPHLDRVFDVAFRGTEARTPGADGGAGLGLAIARGIVEAHHGAITVANEGGGCRFTIRLPAEQPS